MYRNDDNVRLARCVHNARLIDCTPQPLKSVTNYRQAAGVYLQTPLLNYLAEHCLIIPGDWPSQFYQRQMAYSAVAAGM